MLPCILIPSLGEYIEHHAHTICQAPHRSRASGYVQQVLDGLSYAPNTQSHPYPIRYMSRTTQYGATPVYPDSTESDMENHLVVSVSITMLLYAVTNNPVDIKYEVYVRSEDALAGKIRIANEKRLPNP